MLTADDIAGAAPAAPAAPAISPAPAPAPTASGPEQSPLPEEVLQIPAMNALLQGTPPAVSAPVSLKTPEVETLRKNAAALSRVGFGFYRSKDGKQDVMYNTAYLDPGAVRVADQKGQLDTIAPPITDLISHINEAVKGGAPAAPEAAPAPAAPPAPIIAPGGVSGAEKKLQTARIKNATLGSPTSGPVPGQGRLLNNILKTSV
jgi:pyruvate dehydrogenase E2 component (dihydrolipoamide acetyltransferase)